MAKAHPQSPAVLREFDGAILGDQRRNARLGKIVRRLVKKPGAGFPRALAEDADLEGFYRFVRNPEVTFEALLAPHARATVGRLAGRGDVLAVHDTTEFRFGGVRQGLGVLGTSGHGFLGHCTLAVSADGERHPLGMLAVEAWARQRPTATALRRRKQLSYAATRDLPTEQDRWLRGVDAAEATVGDAASLIHVMDSEADDYALMAALVAAQRRWVIRLCYDRVLKSEFARPHPKTREFIARCPVLATRTVALARRRRQPGGAKDKRRRVRRERQATLAISAGTVEFRRPSYCQAGQATLSVNVVAVREVDPPPDDDPIEWLLLTTEPIGSREQVLQVIEYYRGRWVIEEFFKALKTGCAFEKRQLESRAALLIALGLFVPIAWNLLRLRTLARTADTTPARAVLTALELEVLRRAAKPKLPPRPTARAALLAIARLAGHRAVNGEPGWQLLGRGYQDLLMMTAGYQLAQRGEK